jgi:Cupredoxin-like domain
LVFVRRTALLTVGVIGVMAASLTLVGQAAADAPIVLTVKNHHFTPNVIAAPAGQRFTIQVRNLDNTPEEFESYDFKVEKIVVPQGTITVLVGPLKPGVYAFFGDYNPTLAKGVLRVGPAAGKK